MSALPEEMEAVGLRLHIGARRLVAIGATPFGIQLPWSEVAVMSALMRRAPEPATYDTIFRALYGAREEPAYSDKIVQLVVMRLRRKLAGGGVGAAIRNVYGLGYVLEELPA